MSQSNRDLSTMILIDLRSPQTVNGQRAPWQSLWLLLRLLHQHRNGLSPLVRAAELREQFPDARNQRMIISRAFKDFASWGIQIGWGEDCRRDPRLLNPDGRSQGPFWLAEGEPERIRCTLDNDTATEREIGEMLGLNAHSSQTGKPQTDASPGFWMALATAQQAMREGRLLTRLGQAHQHQAGALAGFKEAAAMAGDHLSEALAVLGEASVWRRLDDLSTARKTLARLRKTLKLAGPDDSGYLDAMEQILSAWCTYAQRDVAGTEAILQAMHSHPQRGLVVRIHPRIRFEWHNLMALSERSRALAADKRSSKLRPEHAAAAMAHFAQALRAAFEQGSFDAAQQVAANTGMAIWLFRDQSLIAETAPGHTLQDALRWLLFSEWLCRCAGASGHSAWNAIYLMRIARAACRLNTRLSMRQFRSLTPMPPDTILHSAGNSGAMPDWQSLLPSSWLALARDLYEGMMSGAARYSLLQRCGVCLEYGWYATHAGDLPAARRALDALREAMPDLPPSDRDYFNEIIATLPDDVQSV
ncbi:hypothetical protein KSF73_09310 [Burkholderiaceae bacterium DAT-1]|nr:hypothetical protein [Burkholderiaceae bacterium DAT-1]